MTTFRLLSLDDLEREDKKAKGIDFAALGAQHKIDRTRLCVVICGSRPQGWVEHGIPLAEIEQVVWDVVDTFRDGTQVVTGGAQGVDTWAHEAALRFKLETRVFRADWDRFGRSAGFRRNERMIRHLATWPGSKMIVAFWDGESHGTKHAINYARDLGLDPIVITPTEPVDEPDEPEEIAADSNRPYDE